MQKLTLPEKDWFTFSEIANRWQVDVGTVAHYVWDLHMLRPALLIKQLHLDGLESFIVSDSGHLERAKEEAGYSLSYTIMNSDGLEYNGRFLYVKTEMPDCDSNDLQLFRDFRYTAFVVPNPMESTADCATHYYDPLGNVFEGFDGEQLFFSVMAAQGGSISLEKCIPGIPISNDYVITREERDRFEEKYREEEIQKTGKRQEENSLYAIGMMAMLLAEKSNAFKIGDRPNAEQISRAVNDMAVQGGFDAASLKSLHKKIAEGLKQVSRMNDD